MIAILYFFLIYGIIKLFGRVFLLVGKLAMMVLLAIGRVFIALISQKSIAKV